MTRAISLPVRPHHDFDAPFFLSHGTSYRVQALLRGSRDDKRRVHLAVFDALHQLRQAMLRGRLRHADGRPRLIEGHVVEKPAIDADDQQSDVVTGMKNKIQSAGERHAKCGPGEAASQDGRTRHRQALNAEGRADSCALRYRPVGCFQRRLPGPRAAARHRWYVIKNGDFYELSAQGQAAIEDHLNQAQG
jgi:hypothetical protein